LSDYKGEPENQALTAQQLQSRYQTKTQRVKRQSQLPADTKPTRSLTCPAALCGQELFALYAGRSGSGAKH